MTGAVTNHLQKNHKPEWDAYCETRTKANAKKAVAKEEEKVACEMENNEVRFYDVRSSKGRLPFLKKVGLPDIFLISMMFLVQILPDVAEPPTYWLETDPRAEAGHFGIISQIVIDFQPFSFINNKGFLIDKRKNMPMLQVHTPWWYQDKIEKVTCTLSNACQFSTFFQCADNARQEVDQKLRGDDPSTVWLTLDGWSAETTSYIGVEICMKYK